MISHAASLSSCRWLSSHASSHKSMPQSTRTCLRGLVRDAIGRASSGVLVTAMRQAEGVEIAVLDDGTDPAHQQSAGAAQPGRELPLPRGATLIARYEQGRGMTMLLSVRQLESRPSHPAAGAADEIADSTDV